jgi:hypothetical protein
MAMSDLVHQLELPSDHSAETLYVKRLKEMLAAQGDERGDRLCFTFKLSRDRHGKLLAAASKHGLTVTDILTAHVDQILPVLLKARPVEVPGFKRDLRTRPPRAKGAA